MTEKSTEGNLGVLPCGAQGEEQPKHVNGGSGSPQPIVLCVDAGGSSCRAALMSLDGEIASGVGGPCNVTTTGLEVATATISRAVQAAIDNHPATQGKQPRTVAFSEVWVGMAGYDRLSLRPLINSALSELFGLPLNEGLRVSTDIDLLPAVLSPKQGIDSAIVLVVGTGSVAMSYKRDGNEFQRIGRVGGWGRILGDDGSGYATGREGIRSALRQCDLQRLRVAVGTEPSPFPPLPKAVLAHFQAMYSECDAENLLSTLLVPPRAQGAEDDGDTTRTRNIASAASVVLELAKNDNEARKIVEAGAASVVELVKMLVAEQQIDTTRCALVLGGGLVGNAIYRELVLGGVQDHCGGFSDIESVGQPSVAGARHLLSCNRIEP